MADRADALNSAPPAEKPSRSSRFVLCLAAILAAESAFFAWYWTAPLPNAEAAKTTLPDGTTQSMALRRWHLLAQALPDVIPGMSWNESLVGGAINRLGKTEFLAQRIPIAAVGLLIIAAAIGLGAIVLLLIRPAPLRTPTFAAIAFGLGAAWLGVLTLVFGRLGWLSPAVVRLGLAALALAGCALLIMRAIKTKKNGAPAPLTLHAGSIVGFCVLAAPFVVLMVLGSMQPSIEFDSLEYHLQGPKEWYLSGKIMFLPYNVYTSMPFNVEMLHLLAMHLLGDWWAGALAGQFVVMFHSLAAALAIGLAAAKLGTPRAGLCAALVYLSAPWTYRLSVFGYVEGPLNLYHALLVLVAIEASRAPDPKSAATFWGLAGAFAGGAMACKYPALLTAVAPFAFWMLVDALRRRQSSFLIAFTVGLALTIGPWLAKNVVDHGNPVYPLANSIFHGHPWSPERESQWNRAHGPRPATVTSLIDGASEVAGRNDWQSPLFFTLAPVAFFPSHQRRTSTWLALYALTIFATWYLLTHRLDRFWLPSLVPLAILAGLGADWSRRRAWSAILGLILTLGLASNWIFNTTALAGLNRWTDDLNELRRDVPAMASPTLFWLDANLQPNRRVLLVGQAGVFHLNIAHVYNTVFDEEQLERLAQGRSPAEFHDTLRSRGLTHILVDWAEIARHRKPGGYGFSPFVTQERFDAWERAGVLQIQPCPLPQKRLYRVVP